MLSRLTLSGRRAAGGASVDSFTGSCAFSSDGGEWRGRGTPSFEDEDGGVSDGRGDTRAVGRHRDVMVGLPDRNMEDFRWRLASWPPEQREATVQEVLLLAGKLHYALYVNWPGQYFVHSLLHIANLHLTEEERRWRYVDLRVKCREWRRKNCRLEAPASELEVAD